MLKKFLTYYLEKPHILQKINHVKTFIISISLYFLDFASKEEQDRLLKWFITFQFFKTAPKCILINLEGVEGMVHMWYISIDLKITERTEGR